MLMMSHLHDSAFRYYKRRTSTTRPKGGSKKVGNVWEIEGRGEWTGKVTPVKEVFKGRVFVLMNGYSASATGEFIGHLKNINRATFIGEEAGGNPVMFTGGQTLRVNLPHTHMTGFLPRVLVEMNVRMKNNGHGVIPDHEVKPTIKDILEERDVVMEFAFGFIKKK
jgi:C-terminal processing protease CtpA/Prc